MSWFDGIEENTLVKVELNNGKEVEFYFLKSSNGIVEGRLKDGKLKKFKEDKIEDLEEIESQQSSDVEENKTVNNNKENDFDSNFNKIPIIKTSFLNKIENFTLQPPNFNRDTLVSLKSISKSIYSKVMGIFNTFENAKKINELDLKYNRSQKIIRQLDSILEEEYFGEVDKFLAYVLYKADITYLEFFKRTAEDLYCLKLDLYKLNIKNNKFAFIVAEELFTLYKLNEENENEWLFYIKNIINYNSFKGLKYQLEKISNQDSKYIDLIEESLKYICNKKGLSCNVNTINEKYNLLTNSLQETTEYQNLKNNITKIKDIVKTQKNKDVESEFVDTFSDFGESLIQIVNPNSENELNSYLPPFGYIKSFFRDRNFGFIEDKKGVNYFFTIQNIIDPNIKKDLLNNRTIKQNIEVCFSSSFNYKGEIADAIQKPKKVNELLKDIEKYKQKKEYNIAQKVLEQILSKYPNNLKIKKIYYDLKKSKPKIEKNRTYYNNYYENYGSYGNYRKAKDAKDRKDYDTAVKYFELAYQNDEKLESTIKDLALTYYEIGDIEKSKEFLLNNEDKLSKTITTYNFLENHYFAVGEYKKAIEYIDILLDKTFRKDKEIVLLSKKANCYIKLNDKDRAKEILNEILKLDRNLDYPKRLLDNLESGNIEDIDINVNSFKGGISKFIEETINNYTEFVGIPENIKNTEKLFTKETLRHLQNYIKNTTARPKERVKSLLTEAKLIQELEPDNEEYYKALLRRYCADKAIISISDNLDKEIILFYLIEAIAIEKEWNYILPLITFYIKAIQLDYNSLLNIQLKSLEEKDLIISLSKLDIKNWDFILDVFIVNDVVSKNIIKEIYGNNKLKNNTISYFKHKNINETVSTISKYTNIWNELIYNKKREYDNWFTKINSILKIDNLDILNNQFVKILDDVNCNWLSQLDSIRLKNIQEIGYKLDNYIKEKFFDEKERNKNYLNTEINMLITDIENMPTKISYEGYKPILEHIDRLIRKSFDDFLKASRPIVDIEIMGDTVAVANNNVSLQLKIKNDKSSSPISNVILTILNDENIKCNNKNIKIYETIRGGEEKNIKFDISVSKKVIENLTVDMKIKLQYNTRLNEEVVEKEFTIPIRLYDSSEFKKIANPYASVAEGGPVTEKSMFFGREEYINNIVDSLVKSNNKSIIIYGQKRSGKSSVLYHLKQKLTKDSNAFCIDFSMGDIIEDLSTSNISFYYKIISQIDEELENLEIDGKDIPTFTSPPLNELKENPNIVFYEKLKEFKKSMNKLESWKNKKLIILIDEFTYIYSSIEKGEMSSNFMKTWKAFIEKNYFSAVLVGQDVTPKFKSKFPNEFGVTEDKRLTYLPEESARELIEKPIWDKERDRSRYIGKAVDNIIDYTACSPYYLQMFCSRVVDYMNRKKAISVTEADIDDIANSFIEGSESLSEDKFDNLLTAGDADIETFDLNKVKEILKTIAQKTEIGACSREDIVLECCQSQEIDNILEDLKRREVIEILNGYYKIKVELFKRWLLKQ